MSLSPFKTFYKHSYRRRVNLVVLLPCSVPGPNFTNKLKSMLSTESTIVLKFKNVANVRFHKPHYTNTLQLEILFLKIATCNVFFYYTHFRCPIRLRAFPLRDENILGSLGEHFLEQIHI